MQAESEKLDSPEPLVINEIEVKSLTKHGQNDCLTLTSFSMQRGNTVDGRNPAPVEVGSLSSYLQGFM